MTVVYVDTLFLLNALVDYLLLLLSARLAGEVLHRLRFAAGAAVGGLYAVALFLPGLGFLAHPACRLAAAAGMLLCAFGGSARLARQSVLFLALSCALGGGILAITLLGGTGLALEGGVLYSGMDLKIVLLSAAGCYLVLSATCRRLARHTAASGQLIPARIKMGDKVISITALVDTGNTLTDPVTGQGVMVAEAESVETLFPKESGWERSLLSDPAAALERLDRGGLRGRLRLLPYRAVGVERGLLLAVRMDELTLDGRRQTPALVALSPTPVSDGGGYRALVGELA